MAAKKVFTRRVEKGVYLTYFKKAKDFYQTMHDATAKGNWNSVGLEGVHCVISATDALLAYTSGIRCTSQDHREVVRLLKEKIKTPQSVSHAKHLLKVISMKNLVEYEARDFNEKEARELAKHTERYFTWIKSLIP